MSKYLNHTEQIGSYLEGSMSPDEMLAFENQLHTDPVLRSEFELQEDVVNSIKNFRKSELKARLDQVPVSMGPTTLIGVKTAAVMVLSGIIGISSYIYFNAQVDPVEEPLAENTVVIDAQELPTITELEENPAIEEIADETNNVEEAVTEAAAEESTASSNNPVTTKPVEEKLIAVAKEAEDIPSPIVNSPKVIDPSLDETVQEEALEIPTSAIAQDESVVNPAVEIETAKKDSELFHYQYFSGKLYLYGDFRDNPYEILELNSASGKKLFMFYNLEYFQILDNQTDLTPLEKLQDPEVIKELEIIKENK